MSIRTLVALWKANVPHWVWITSPAWIGAVVLGFDGRAPEWGPLVLFVAAVLSIQTITEFANSYTDRFEDQLYGPTNTLVTGELDAATAKKVLVLENIVAGSLLLALLLVTLNYYLIVVMLVGWFLGLAYSLPPFRLKETVYCPLSHGLALALLPIAGWLIVEPSLTARNGFIVAFAAFFFLASFALGITLKFRKTLLALADGLIEIKQGSDLPHLSTVGLGLKLRTALALEDITSLGAFVLVPVFWHLGIFDTALSIGLLALPLPLAVLAMILRIKDPLKNSTQYKVLTTLSWILIVALFFGVALASAVHWGFALLACIAFLTGFPILTKIVHPWGCKSPGGREIAGRQDLAVNWVQYGTTPATDMTSGQDSRASA